jgi:hypothetical protein
MTAPGAFPHQIANIAAMSIKIEKTAIMAGAVGEKCRDRLKTVLPPAAHRGLMAE